jgi:hypothetical protein
VERSGADVNYKIKSVAIRRQAQRLKLLKRYGPRGPTAQAETSFVRLAVSLRSAIIFFDWVALPVAAYRMFRIGTGSVLLALARKQSGWRRGRSKKLQRVGTVQDRLPLAIRNYALLRGVASAVPQEPEAVKKRLK